MGDRRVIIAAPPTNELKLPTPAPPPKSTTTTAKKALLRPPVLEVAEADISMKRLTQPSVPSQSREPESSQSKSAAKIETPRDDFPEDFPDPDDLDKADVGTEVNAEVHGEVNTKVLDNGTAQLDGQSPEMSDDETCDEQNQGDSQSSGNSKDDAEESVHGVNGRAVAPLENDEITIPEGDETGERNVASSNNNNNNKEKNDNVGSESSSESEQEPEPSREANLGLSRLGAAMQASRVRKCREGKLLETLDAVVSRHPGPGSAVIDSCCCGLGE